MVSSQNLASESLKSSDSWVEAELSKFGGHSFCKGNTTRERAKNDILRWKIMQDSADTKFGQWGHHPIEKIEYLGEKCFTPILESEALIKSHASWNIAKPKWCNIADYEANRGWFSDMRLHFIWPASMQRKSLLELKIAGITSVK